MTTVSGVAPAEMCAALADDTRWSILTRLGSSAASASALAKELPVSRQAIVKHLDVLRTVGLVRAHREGRQVRFEVVGAPLSQLARRLERIAAAWDARLADIKRLAEGD